MNKFFKKGQQDDFYWVGTKFNFAKFARDFCIDFAIAIAAVMFVIQFVQPNRVYQESMVPTYADRDTVFVNKTAYHNSEPEPGDIIVFKSGDAERKRYIKRVVGVSGDHVEIHDGEVFVNNIRQNQSYTNEGFTDGYVDVVVPNNTCFVLGDNRSVSIDSRAEEVGCVSYDKIIGKVMFAKQVVMNEEAK
jgi:signal peptidase I